MARPDTVLAPIVSKKPGMPRAQLHFCLLEPVAPDGPPPECLRSNCRPSWARTAPAPLSEHPVCQELFVYPPEQWLHLLGLIVAEHWIDPGDIPTVHVEAKILVLQISQALTSRAAAANKTIDIATWATT